MNLSDLTLCEASVLLKSREISSADLAAALLERAGEMAWMNAFNFLDPERVLAEARSHDLARSRNDESPMLHGLPISIKDNIACAGFPMSANTPALSSHVPDHDAGVVRQLKSAGAIIFGTNSMHEIACGVTSNNAFGGPVRNAFHPGRIPGGSSGGTGAAVGGRVVPAGIGTDTGGSVRVPAAFNGIFGFRPSVGRWPTDGLLQLSNTRDTPGPLARCVGDLDLLDRTLTGRGPAAKLEVANLRLGRPGRYFWEHVAPDVRRACEEFLRTLEGAGASIIDVDLHDLAQEVAGFSFRLVFREIRPNLTAFLDRNRLGITTDELLDALASPDVREIGALLRDSSASMTGEEYQQTTEVLIPSLRAKVSEVFAAQALDAIVHPTAPVTAPPIGEDATIQLMGEHVPTFLTITRNLDIGSTIGLPSVSLPVGVDGEGLPIGITIEGAPWRDAHVLSAAMALEQLLPPLPRPRSGMNNDPRPHQTAAGTSR